MKINGKTVKARVRATRNPLFGDEKYTGGEPVWDTERAEKFTDEEFDHFLRKSFYYYNYYYNQKDCKKYVIQWIKDTAVYDVEDVKTFERASDRSIPMTVCSLIMAHRQGMPLRERHTVFIHDCIKKAIAGSDDEAVSAVVSAVPATPPPTEKAPEPTIQDRMNERTSETIGELEGHYDEFITNSTYQFKPYDFLVTHNVAQSQLGKYQSLFQDRLDELKTAQSKSDEQLAEGYSHYRSQDFRRITAFIEKILADIEQYRGVKRLAKKARAPRSVSKEKVVSKLKYTREDKLLKLISINPVDILGAQELWFYNTKTRRLGRYMADSLTGPLGVKGTGITGYDEAKSVSKTLRKPEEKLREFAKATKIELRKFLDNIKATETKLNGRITADVVLLKAL